MLYNPELKAELEKNGFVKFSFLDTDMLGQVNTLFQKYIDFHAFTGRYHLSTFHLGNNELSAQVDTDIKTLIGPSVDRHFEDIELFLANFMLKEPGAESEVEMHQDWTYVDETRYRSFNIWVPLQDVDEHNGCLTFLPGSHALHYTMRPSPVYPNLFDRVKDAVKKKMVSVPMKAGEALVFFHSTLHGSHINRSGKRRFNIVVGGHSAQAQLQHLYTDEPGRIRKYNITVDDFYKLREGRMFEHIQPEETVQFEYPQLSLAEFESIYGR